MLAYVVVTYIVNNKEAVMEHFTIVSMFHAASLQSIIMFVIIFPDKSVLFYTLE